MLPVLTTTADENIQTVTIPNKTYKLDLSTGRVAGYVDKLEAIKQAVFKILQTERYNFLIYDWNYGSEFANLLNKNFDYVKKDIQRVIKEALTADVRIKNVTDFDIQQNSNSNLLVKFIVESTEGTFQSEVII